MLKNKHSMQEYYSKTVCYNKVKWAILVVFFMAQSPALWGQCTDPSISLPDENQPVSNPSVSYCVSIPINPAVTGDPIGFSLELDHTFIGDLSIRVSACGETLMLMTRPGGGACTAGAPFGSSATVNGFYTFSEGGGPDPDPNLATNGGDYGLSGDPCGINTVNTFAELAAACGGGTYDIEFCITDHAFVNTGFAGNIAPIFPGVPPTICGCTDPLALNYDPAASFDDGSCEYPPGCGENFYDSGGPSGDYPSNANETVTICADVPGDVVTVSFSFFDVENGFDNLAIYDGPTAGSPLIGNYDGTNSPGSVTSTHSSGCLTFVFTSDGSVQDPGWAATVFCEPPCVPPAPPSVSAPTICEGESASISASGCPSGTIQWFNSPTSTTPIAIGPVYSTPPLNTSATYYVACDNNGCASDRTPVTVQVTAPQTPALTPVGPLCQGDAPVALSNVQGGISGTWSGQGVNGGVFNPQLVSPGSNVPITFTPDPGQCALPADLFIEVLVQPVPQITGPGVICQGNTEFLTVVGTYATYVWNTGDSGSTLPISSSGTYTVTVTSLAGGCPGQASFTVDDSPPPNPVISGDLDICTGETTTLTVPNTFATYNWSNGGSGPATTVTQPGPVSITVTDASGCEGTATVQVDETFIAPPNISAPQTLCAGTGGTVAITNAALYDSFSWSTGGNAAVIAIPGPGTYTVTATQGGCEATGTVTVAENFAIPPTINGALAICQGETTELSVSPSYASYSWSTGGTDQTETVSQNGFVGVTVTDNQGCVAETNTIVDVSAPPNVQLTGDEVACDGAFAVIAVQDPGSYAAFNWSNSETGSTIAVSAGGSYTVTATDNNGCEGTATFTVTQAPLPNADITGVNSFCTGGSTQLSAVADGLDYAWSTGDNTQTTTVTEPGEVFLTVTNAEGCQSINNLTVTETDELLPQIEGPTAFCSGNAITLTTNGDFDTYQWSDGSGGPSITISQPGTVGLTVTDVNGCDGSTSVAITENALPDIAIDGALAFCEGGGTALSAPAGMATYTWSDSSAGPMLGVTEPGTYGLTITDANGCSNTAQATVVENPLPQPEITGTLGFCADTTTTLSLTEPYAAYQWSDGSSTAEITRSESEEVSVTVTDANGCTNEDSVQITSFPLPEPAILGQNQFCEGDSLSLAANQSFAAYAWSNSGTDSVILVDAAGDYELAVTDENGCTATAQLTVVANPLPDADIAGSLSYCASGSTLLSAPAGLSSYQWTGGAVTQDLAVTAPGTYGLTVTDENNCTNTAEAEVVENALPEPQITGPLAFCSDTSTTLVLNQDFDSYAWSDGSTGPELTVGATQAISVTVTNAAGCQAADSVAVSAYPLPEVAILGPEQFCEGESATLAADQTFAAYQWSDNSTDSVLAVNSSGEYSLTVTDENGCAGTADFTVEQTLLPEASITGDTVFCAGDSTLLTAPAGFDSYLWEGGASTPSLSVTAPGTYGLTVTNGAGCTDSIAVAVVEENLPVPQIVGPVAFCPDSTVELSLSASYNSISWSDGSNGPTLQVNNATTVSVEVANAAGCVGSDSVETLVFQAPEVNIQGEAAFCAGDTVTLAPSEDFAAYLWSNGSTEADIEAAEAGTYALTVTDANGCPASDAITITENSLPAPEITGSDFFCAGQETTLQATPGFEAYEWGNGETVQTLTVSTPGEYSLIVTDSNGCQGATAFEVGEIALPQPAIEGAAQFCPGDSTTLSADAIYAAYAWSTGDTTGSIIVDAPDEITLTVTNTQGCADSTTLAAEWFDTEVPQVDGAPNFCPGTSTQISAEAGFAAYQWNTNTTSSGLTVTEAGTYSVTVTDANGCQTSNSIAVGEFNVSPPEITGPEGFCADATATLQAEGNFNGYQWSTGAETAEITVDSGGIFSLTVTDANGCMTDAAYQLVAYGLPQVAIGGSATFCPGGFATLNAGGDYASYLWSEGSTTPSIQVNEEGIYTLEVTDENGCTNSADLEVTEEAELSPVVSGPLQFCPGTSTVLNAGAGYAVYNWENGPNAAEITVTEPGTYSVYVEDASGCSGTAEVEVGLFPEPAVAIDGPAGFCEDESAILVANGDNIAAYEWQDGSFQPQLEVEELGAYTVIATDNNGCLDTATYAIETYPLPEVAIEATPYFCAGESTTLSASGTFAAYAWNGEAGQASLQADTPGPYVLEVTDSNGCQSETSLMVEEIELPVADAGTPDTLTCEVEAVTLGGNATSTGLGFVYEWSGPGINAMNATVAAPTVTQPGLYQLAVLDTVHNCAAVPDEAEVPLSNDVPIASLVVDDTLDCLTTSLVIDGSASSDGPGLSYQWFDGAGNLLASDTNQFSTESPGTFVLQVEDVETGCQQQDTALVSQDIELPDAEAGAPQRLDCAVTEVALSVAGSSQGDNFAFDWQNELSDTFASGDSVTVTEPGTYTLVVTNLTNNCQQSDEVVITQDIEAPVADAGSAQQIDCLNPTATLNGSGSSTGGAFVQQWAFGQPDNVIGQELSITVDSAGLYYLVVTNTDNQCESTATVEVSEIASAPSALLTTASGPSCFGDENGTIVIGGVEGGTSPYLYSFNGGPFDAQQSFNGLSGGVYDIVVQDAIGCEHETSVLLPEGNDLDIDLGGEITVNLGEEVQLFAQVNIPEEEVERLAWQATDSLSCTDCYDPWVRPSTSGLYQVQVTDLNGCTASDQVQLFVDKRRRVYLPNVFSPNGDGANDVFFVQAGPEVVNIEAFEVYSRWGEPVFTVFNVPANEPDFGWNGQYRGELFNGGVFTWFARVEYVDGVVEVFKGDVLLMR